MASFLDQADVKRLMNQPSPHVRAIIAHKVALEIDRPELTESELERAHEIIRALARDIEVIVRRAVAQNLRSSRRLPHDVAVKLAEDVEIVALPVLAHSLVLTDEDLIALLGGSSQVKQQAIASRPHLPEQVADAVIGTTNENVVAALMGNATARIGDMSFTRAVDRFEKSDIVKESMAMRAHLPAAIAERLVALVSDRLREHLAVHHDLPPKLAAEILEQGRERALIHLNAAANPEEIGALVHQMHEDRRLTPTFVLRALCAGNRIFFEHAMAALAGIPVANARQLINDPGTEPLNALCRKTGMPSAFVRVMRAALDILDQLRQSGQDIDVPRFRARLIERVLSQTADRDRKDQDYLLDLIK